MTINPQALEGCTRLVFDAAHWSAVGHDVGDNSMFWKPARIVRVWHDGYEWIADVTFVDSGKESSGHFVSGFRDV